jgi:hypothetical protein
MTAKVWAAVCFAVFGLPVSQGVYAQDVAQPMAAAPSPQPRAASKPPTAAVQQELLKSAQEKLSGDEAAIRQGLGALASLGGEAASQAVVTRLRRGLPPQLIEVAIDALVQLRRPSAGPALLELLQHRRMQLRVKAMAALAALEVRSAQSALLYALDDPSGEVREAAVLALSRVGQPRALPALFTAAERGVPGAWQAIGRIASPADLKALVARAPHGDPALIRPALDALLERTNLPLDGKLRAVQLVQGLGSAGARACLVEWLAALPADAQPRMRTALLQAVQRIDREHPELKTAAVARATPTDNQPGVGVTTTTLHSRGALPGPAPLTPPRAKSELASGTAVTP